MSGSNKCVTTEDGVNPVLPSGSEGAEPRPVPYQYPLDRRGFFCHAPDWRWLAAQEDFAGGRRASPSPDPVIRNAVRYLRDLSVRVAGIIAELWPELSAAHAIYTDAGPVRDEIEARILAGESFAVVGQKTGVAPDVVAMFDTVFYDVSNRLRATDWLLQTVVRLFPGLPYTEGQAWKYLALAGGLGPLEILIDDFYDRPQENPEEFRVLVERTRLAVREQATNWSSPTEAKAMLDDMCRLLPCMTEVAMHVEFLRMVCCPDPAATAIDPDIVSKPAVKRRRGGRKTSPRRRPAETGFGVSAGGSGPAGVVAAPDGAARGNSSSAGQLAGAGGPQART